MYFTHNTAEEVKAKLTSYLNTTLATIEAWRNVTIERKKDGSEFAKLGQAIKGAKLSTAYPAHDAAHPALYVYFMSDGAHKEDYINAYFYCDEMPDKGASRETVYGGGILRKTSPMTAQELRQAILTYIAILEERAGTYKKQIAICEEAFTTYRNAIAEADKKLKELCNTAKRPNQIGETSLYYKISETR